MIYKDSIEAILEAIYLREGVCGEIGKTNIRVNPAYDRLELKYTIGKTIVLNDSIEEPDIIKELEDPDKENTIISRTKYPDPKIIFNPYILRIDFNIMWNGEIIQCPQGFKNSREVFRWIGDVDDFEYEEGKEIELCFPKIRGIPRDFMIDEEDNLTSLGWLMQQVGENIKTDTNFVDLDLIKTKKLGIKRGLKSYK